MRICVRLTGGCWVPTATPYLDGYQKLESCNETKNAATQSNAAINSLHTHAVSRLSSSSVFVSYHVTVCHARPLLSSENCLLHKPVTNYI